MAQEVRADLLLGRDTLSPGLVKAGRAASDASGNIRQLTRDLFEVGKQRATPIVDLQDTAATAKLDDVAAKLKDLGAKVADPKIDVQDKASVASVASMQVKLDRLSRLVASPRITLEGLARAEAGVTALDLELDKLDGRKAVATVDVRPSLGSRLRGLFPGGGHGTGGILSGLGSAGQAGGGAISALGPYGQGALYGIGGTLGASVLPALLPTLLGLGIGGAGIMGAFKAGSSADKALTKLQTALASASGKQKQVIKQQIDQLQKQDAGVLKFYSAAQGIVGSFNQMFLGALSAKGPGYSAGPGGQPGAPSFLTSVMGIFKQIAGFIKTLGPDLGNLFRASVPFLQMFVKFGEQAVKLVLPVFTQLLQRMIPYLPLIDKGLLNIVQGFTGFLNALGPSGMQAAAKIFVALTKVMDLAMTGLGKAVNWLATNIPVAVHDIAKWWDWMRHHTANVFDGIRHDIAHYWDMTWNNSIGMVIRFGHNVETQFNSVRHEIAVIFDGVRHDIAHIWDMIFENTMGRVIRGVHDMESAFDAGRKFFETWTLRLEILFAGWAKNILHYAQDAFGWLPGWLPGISGIKKGLATAESDLRSFVKNAQGELADLTSKHYALTFGLNLPAGVSYPSRPIKGRAGGGGVGAGEWALVGERGPELAYFAGGGHVIPNGAIRGYAGGSGPVTVHLSTPSIQAMGSMLSSTVAAIVAAVRKGAQFSGSILGGAGSLGRAGLRGLENLWTSAGGPGGMIAHIAAAIALAESGGNPRAYNPSGASGLWQILGQVVGGNIFNPFINALNAVKKFRDAGGFSPWVTYTTGAYRQFMDSGGWLRPGWNPPMYNGTGRPEHLVPTGKTRSGPLVNIEGNLVVRERADANLIASKLNFAIQASWMG